MEAFATAPLIRTLPASQASFATVRRLIRRDTFKNLSSLILIFPSRNMNKAQPFSDCAIFQKCSTNYALTASFKAFPALNFGALQASIFIVFPVCGFLPSLAALSLTSNVPKPTNCTFSPFLSSSDTTSMKDFKTASTSLFGQIGLFRHSCY